MGLPWRGCISLICRGSGLSLFGAGAARTPVTSKTLTRGKMNLDKCMVIVEERLRNLGIRGPKDFEKVY